MGMDKPNPPRSPGRPRTKDGEYDKPRAAGRIGQLWDDCAAQAKADGETMSDFVKAAIARELALRQRRAARRTDGSR